MENHIEVRGINGTPERTENGWIEWRKWGWMNGQMLENKAACWWKSIKLLGENRYGWMDGKVMEWMDKLRERRERREVHEIHEWMDG